jgi:hypothetical protein
MVVIMEVPYGKARPAVRKMYHSPVQFPGKEQEITGILPY